MISFFRIGLCAVVHLSFVLCMISLHFINGLLFYFLAPSLFKRSMQLAEYLSSTLVILLAHISCPSTSLKISFADARTQRKFQEYRTDRSKGEAASDLVICNHQLYTDWIYIWALLTHMGKGGNVKITLKKSLQWTPVLGWGMKIIGFIFISRKWNLDRPKFIRRIARLAAFKPFSFLIFPEGTTLCKNGLEKSDGYAQRLGIPSTQNVLIPRTLGMYTSLLAIKDSIEGVWDLTACYSDIPSHLETGLFPEDLFGLSSLFGDCRAPYDVHFHLRFIPISEITPLLDDETKFAQWLQDLYITKDALLQKAYAEHEYPQAALCLPIISGRDIRNVLVAVSALLLLMLSIKLI